MGKPGRKEVEIKFAIDDIRALERRLRQAGFHRVIGRTHEINTLYDLPGGVLRARGELLRIRKYGKRWVLTHKASPQAGSSENGRTAKPNHAASADEPAPVPDGNQTNASSVLSKLTGDHPRPGGAARHKTRLETETEIADGAKLAHILSALGFAPSFRYEKFRSEWTDGRGHVVIDETPIGNLSEIEGSPRWIDQTARALGVHRSQYITANYAGLFFDWKKRTGSPAEEMTFKAVSTGSHGTPASHAARQKGFPGVPVSTTARAKPVGRSRRP